MSRSCSDQSINLDSEGEEQDSVPENTSRTPVAMDGGEGIIQDKDHTISPVIPNGELGQPEAISSLIPVPIATCERVESVIHEIRAFPALEGFMGSVLEDSKESSLSKLNTQVGVHGAMEDHNKLLPQPETSVSDNIISCDPNSDSILVAHSTEKSPSVTTTAFDVHNPSTSADPKPIENAKKKAKSTSSDPTKSNNRCQICKKKVGLTGITCRCGGLFCSQHRYTDTHDCSFDYRKLGAEEIRKNNPVVIGEKITKI